MSQRLVQNQGLFNATVHDASWELRISIAGTRDGESQGSGEHSCRPSDTSVTKASHMATLKVKAGKQHSSVVAGTAKSHGKGCGHWEGEELGPFMQFTTAAFHERRDRLKHKNF